MQYPCVSGRGHNQQFDDVDYGRLLGVIKKEGKLFFKEEGTPFDFIELDPPEKSAPPGRKFTVYNQLLYFYTNHSDVYLPVSVATDLLLPSLSASKQPVSPSSQETCLPGHMSCTTRVASCDDLLLWACGPDLSTLGVARLVPPHTPTHKTGSFLTWVQCHSPLPFTSLQSLSMPGQIQHIQVNKINGKGIVCVRSEYHLCILQVSEGKLEVVRVHQTQHRIMLSALSPYVPEECLVFTEPGELCLVSRSKVTQIATPTEGQPCAMCFGAHPRSVVMAIGNTLYKVDWRLTPVSTHVLYECKHLITCLSHDPSDPFIIAVATSSHLMLIDMRESGQPVLSVQLNFLKPPTYMYITSVGTSQESLVMLVSVNECMVVGMSRDPPRRVTILPHLVTDLRSLHNRLIVAELPCEGHLSHVAHRLKRPIIGASLWHADSTYTAVIITDLGDVFYQKWTYKATPSSQAASLCSEGYNGYNLWIEEAFTQEKELGKYREMDPVGDFLFRSRRSKETLMDYILSPEAPSSRLCVRCHYVTKHFIPHIDPTQHPSSLATTENQCTFCGGTFSTCEPVNTKSRSQVSSVTAASAMASLREYCTPSEATTELDQTLLSTWTD